MRPRTVMSHLAPLGIVLALTLGACASAMPAGSGAEGSRSVASAAGSAHATGLPSPVAAGTQSVIPPAPGTAGSSALPPIVTAPPVTTGGGVVATPLPACKSAMLKTVNTGRLTITTAAVTAAPWFVGGEPAAGRGLEPAVALAVAKELGYAATDVIWTKTDPAAVVAGKAARFDLAIGEFATPDRASTLVDYSTGYFSISQSVVARTGTPAAAARSLAQLRSAHLATVSGTDGEGVATAEIAGAKAPARYASAAAGLAALRAGTVDAAVVPTPDAVTAGPGVVVVGQLVEQGEQPPQFGMILPKNSPLTSCVSAAIDQLRVTGVLKTLVQTWVPAAARPLT